MEAFPEPESAVSFPAGGKDDASLLRPATLRKGDIHSCMFRFQGTAAAQQARLGTLVLRWRRKGCDGTAHHASAPPESPCATTADLRSPESQLIWA